MPTRHRWDEAGGSASPIVQFIIKEVPAGANNRSI